MTAEPGRVGPPSRGTAARATPHRPTGHAIRSGQPAGGTLAWLAERRRAHRTAVRPIPFAAMEGWGFDPDTGNLRHTSGRFFTIEGLWVRTSQGPVAEWSQPIIHQAEIAILGILLDRTAGAPRLLMQAKVEPGNVNTVQLSPTVQATPSNYTRVHGGPAPPYLEYFTDPDRGRRHVDVLQSEQGGWFFQKRNRNMLVEVTEDVPVHEDFRWVPLAEIGDLLATDNVVNADARTVLSCAPLAWPGASPPRGVVGPFRSALVRSAREADRGRHTMAEVLHWITALRSRFRLDARLVPLGRVGDWRRGPTTIERAGGGTFRVVAVRVEATSREVTRWTQPLVQPCGVGLTGLLVRAVDGVLHVLVQALVEPGNRDIVEVAPTVQYQPAGGGPVDAPLFLDVLASARPDQIRFDAVQSDEGGRFHHSTNRHLVVEVEEAFDPPLPDVFRWLTLHQLAALSAHSNYVNIQARSLLLCLYSLW